MVEIMIFAQFSHSKPLCWRPNSTFQKNSTPQLFVGSIDLSNGTTFAAIGTVVWAKYWYNRFLATVFYYIRLGMNIRLFWADFRKFIWSWKSWRAEEYSEAGRFRRIIGFWPNPTRARARSAKSRLTDHPQQRLISRSISLPMTWLVIFGLLDIGNTG